MKNRYKILSLLIFFLVFCYVSCKNDQKKEFKTEYSIELVNYKGDIKIKVEDTGEIYSSHIDTLVSFLENDNL